MIVIHYKPLENLHFHFDLVISQLGVSTIYDGLIGLPASPVDLRLATIAYLFIIPIFKRLVMSKPTHTWLHNITPSKTQNSRWNAVNEVSIHEKDKAVLGIELFLNESWMTEKSLLFPKLQRGCSVPTSDVLFCGICLSQLLCSIVIGWEWTTLMGLVEDIMETIKHYDIK